MVVLWLRRCGGACMCCIEVHHHGINFIWYTSSTSLLLLLLFFLCVHCYSPLFYSSLTLGVSCVFIVVSWMYVLYFLLIFFVCFLPFRSSRCISISSFIALHLARSRSPHEFDRLLWAVCCFVCPYLYAVIILASFQRRFLIVTCALPLPFVFTYWRNENEVSHLDGIEFALYFNLYLKRAKWHHTYYRTHTHKHTCIHLEYWVCLFRSKKSNSVRESTENKQTLIIKVLVLPLPLLGIISLLFFLLPMCLWLLLLVL